MWTWGKYVKVSNQDKQSQKNIMVKDYIGQLIIYGHFINKLKYP